MFSFSHIETEAPLCLRGGPPLFAPGSLAFGPSARAIAATLGLQLAWLVALALATWLVDRAAMARFADHGV